LDNQCSSLTFKLIHYLFELLRWTLLGTLGLRPTKYFVQWELIWTRRTHTASLTENEQKKIK